MTYNRVKEVYEGTRLWRHSFKMRLTPYILLIRSTFTESANLTEPEGPAEGIAFAGMADQEGQGEHKGEESDWMNEETQHCHHLHIRRLNSHAHPVHEVRSAGLVGSI